MDLFSMNRNSNIGKLAPLADRLRPKSLKDFYGQDHILAQGKYLRRLIESGSTNSMILYGPPGTGKTTLATIISKETSSEFEKLSAVSAGKKDIEKVVEIAKDNLGIYNKRTILFIDEIHRFNKAQQDALLPHVENGLLTLVGATTENPYINVNKALLSRCQVIELKPLSRADIQNILERALEEDPKLREKNPSLDPKAMAYLVQASKGDARLALNSLEIAVMSTSKRDISLEDMKESVLIRTATYDGGEDEHYNTISAFIKSIRGSDVDAAIYYLARMIVGGEDPLFIARRLVISASEDIGLADPQAMVIAGAALEAVKNIGMPEGRIPLAEATAYLALAPKSNSTYKAINKAITFVNQEDNSPIPYHLRDSHYQGAKDLGVGGYVNPHDRGGYVDQVYLPDDLGDISFYEPGILGQEKELLDRYKNLTKK